MRSLVLGTFKFGTIVSGFALICLGSCSSKKEDLTPLHSGETVLTIKMKGSEESEQFGSLSELSPKASLGAQVSSENLVYGNGFDALVSFDRAAKSPEVSRVMAKTKAAESNLPKNIIKTLEQNIQYRILLFDLSGRTLKKNIVATAGVDPEITVDAGISYKWIAFSINERTVPNISNNKVAAKDIANRDVLYATGTLEAKKGQNYLNVVLSHKMTKFDIDIDTKGIFGPIENFSVMQLGTGTGSKFKSLIKSADLDLLSGNFGIPVSVEEGKEGVNIVSAPGTADMVKRISVYTILPKDTEVPAKMLTIQPIFNIKLDHAVVYPPSLVNIPTRNYGAKEDFLSISNVKFKPKSGEKYSLNVRMIESGLPAAGLVWARSDLWYDGREGIARSDRHRFRPDAGHEVFTSDGKTEFWNWMALTPEGSPGSGDPCKEVYPKGTWRMPSHEEMCKLVDQSSYEYYGLPNLAGYKDVCDTYNFFVVPNQSWKSTGSNMKGDYSAYSDKIIFTFNGDRSKVGKSTMESRSDFDYRVLEDKAVIGNVQMRYWTSSQVGADKARAIDQSCKIDYKKPYFYSTAYGKRSTGNTFQKKSGFNVRCVRTKS